MENIHPIAHRLVGRKQKEQLLNQKSGVFWLTGLSGSGKSTIAVNVEKELFKRGYLVQILDGDNIRTGICKNLGFSLADRKENIRRIAEVSRLFIESGIICINCFVSPTREIRENAKLIIGANNFNEVYISTTLEECEKRDVKGLYAKARSGQLLDFTGIDSPYESPLHPSLTIRTEDFSVEQSTQLLLDHILEKVT